MNLAKKAYFLLLLTLRLVWLEPLCAMKTNEKQYPNEDRDEVLQGKYGDILKDETIVFHGIGYRYDVIKSICTYGILSQKVARELNLVFAHNYGTNEGGLYNGNDKICVASSPVRKYFSHGVEGGSFRWFIKSDVAFVIDGKDLRYQPNWKEVGDLQVKERIEPSKIIGVMLPLEKLKEPLEYWPLSALTNGSYDRNEQAKLTAFYNFLKKELGMRDPHIEATLGSTSFLSSQYNQIEIFERLKDLFIKGFSKKLNIRRSKITSLDVVLSQIPADMKIFDSNGFDVTHEVRRPRGWVAQLKNYLKPSVHNKPIEKREIPYEQKKQIYLGWQKRYSSSPGSRWYGLPRLVIYPNISSESDDYFEGSGLDDRCMHQKRAPLLVGDSCPWCQAPSASTLHGIFFWDWIKLSYAKIRAFIKK